MEERGSAGGGVSLPQAACHVLFARGGRRGRRGSIALSLSVDLAARLQARFPWLLLLLPVLGAASVLLYRALKLPAHLATDTMVDRLRRNDRVPPALAPGILAGTFLTVLGGGSVGKEAAALQMGASLGALVGRPFKLAPVRAGRPAIPRGYAAAAGMAACFGALFFAPLGSTVFVLELARFD
ncbi:MAG: chloride channel protein, partial [Eggerthellaceae bacterium]